MYVSAESRSCYRETRLKSDLFNKAIKVGLKGEFSPHSLRYAWAQDAIRHYLAQGFSEKESLALTATDLGHGDGRGRWVKQVYGYRWREE